MKTLIINGSPKSNGNTSVLIEALKNKLNGEIKQVDCYTVNITPCRDCGYCKKENSCIISDEMQEVYSYISECDNIVIASPIFYSELTGKLLDLASRFQIYYNSRSSHGAVVISKPKKGVVILTAGGSTKPDKAYDTAKLILHEINVTDIYPLVGSFATDKIPASEDLNALAQISEAADFLNNIPEPETGDIINRYSTPDEKIKLYRSLFKGRDDVYSLRWFNTKTGRSGYSPVCANKWIPGICDMSKVKCPSCPNRAPIALTDKAIYDHLSGKDELCRDVIGLYPMLTDETVWFLAIDFDDNDWKNDVLAVKNACNDQDIPSYIERSRSGEGAHLWIFFEEPITAKKSRKLGSCLLTEAMNKRHEIKFKSYDRMFPNQDTMPEGGYGNLIALPLQKQAIKKGNSVFVDDDFVPYPDQWSFLSSVKKINNEFADKLISLLGVNHELGELYTEEKNVEPWERQIFFDEKLGLPETVNIVIANMLYIRKDNISQKALNRIKRLAAFKNPDFYKAQALRLSTHDKPRIITLADEDDNYIMLPRGCYEDLYGIVSRNCSKVNITDKRNYGRTIDVIFNGTLRNDQSDAVNEMIRHNCGVLAATTAFGKTVTAAAIIAEKQVNTLILVHTQALLSQWKHALSEFLVVNEMLPEQPHKKGRKKQLSVIGQIGAGKRSSSGIIDIAVIQSLIRDNEVDDIVKNYGMVIVDECHHVSAYSFETVLREVNAGYVYGLTATPKRSDGHQPIIFMQCGKIRYTANAKEYALKHSFNHILVPRFTKFCPDTADNHITITQMYKLISESTYRNNMIADDVRDAIKQKRNPIVISERLSHLETLYDILKGAADHIFILSGQGTAKSKRELLDRIRNIPDSESVILLATGKYVGEGFDEPRLDMLFLVSPISWSGTLSQYVGRLHREYINKTSVIVYDYADIKVPVFEKMYKKRLKGYAGLGYRLNSNSDDESGYRTIYTENFENDLIRDVLSAERSVYISASYIGSGKIKTIIRLAQESYLKGIVFKIIIKKGDTAYYNKLKSIFAENNIEFIAKNKLTSSNVIIDGKTVWYSSGELFYNSDDECVLRITDELLASELIENIR